MGTSLTKPSLSVYCLGNLRIVVNESDIATFETDKARALLIYLAVEADHLLKRSHLAGLFWPDETEARALHNLRQTLVYLRNAVEKRTSGCQLIVADRENIGLNPEADLWVDVRAFEALFSKGLSHYQNQIGRGLYHVRYLKRAAELYQGEFLRGVSVQNSILFDEWLILHRESLNLKAVRILSTLSKYHEERSEISAAIETSIRIVSVCPWDEVARARVMRLLAMDGQWSAAKAEYQSLKRYFADQLVLEPGQKTEQLYQSICCAEEGQQTISAERHAVYCLPERQSVFIGRDAELDDLMEMLISGDIRLITLWGIGGVGKTMLALEVARQCVGVFPDGVFFVSMVSANTADQMVNLILESFNWPVFQKNNLGQLIDLLRNRHCLLVLDNFDHLVKNDESLRLISSLIEGTQFLTVLVTSREVLHLSREHIFGVTGLDYPGAESRTLERAQQLDSIRLFMQRVNQKIPKFSMTNENLPVIVRMCNQLEGLPLGLELAAAATSEQGFDFVMENFEHNLSLLKTRMSDYDERHRSLDAAFETSWAMLSPEYQGILYRLSFFMDGFNRDAAESVAAASVQILSDLRSKSLIRFNRTGRYDIHEAIRQYVNRKEVDDQIAEQVRDGHAAYFCNFLFQLNAALLNENQTKALAEIQQELGNISTCWQWIVTRGQVERIVQCVDSLFHYFNIRSFFLDGISWFARAVDRLQEMPGTELARGMLLWRLGTLAYYQRDNARMIDSLSRSEALLLSAGNERELAQARLHRGWVFHRDKDFGKAHEYAQQAFASFEDAHDLLGLTQSLLLLGSIENRQGNFTQSEGFFTQALEFCRQTKNPRNLVTILNRLGDVVSYRGEYALATQLFQESLTISKELNDRFNQAVLLNNLGTIAHIQQDYQLAETYYQQSLAIARDINDLDGIALALSNLGELATWQENYDEAILYAQEALKIAQDLNEAWTIIVCLNSLGEIYRGMEELAKSAEYFLDAIRISIEIQGWDLVTRIAINLGRTYQLLGESDRARQYYLAAYAHSSTEQDSREKAKGWLAEMGVTPSVMSDDSLIKGIIEELKCD